MLSSRWPRLPSHGKCSKRFCGSSRSYGRSHHQRYRETFDVMHSRAADSRSAPKSLGKWPGQALDQAVGLPEVLVAVSTSRLSCKRARKARTLMPVWDSSGESQLNARYRKVRYHSASRCHPRRRCVRVNGGKNDSRQNAVARTTTEVQRRAPSTKSLNSATRLTKTSTTVIRSIEASWG